MQRKADLFQAGSRQGPEVLVRPADVRQVVVHTNEVNSKHKEKVL